MARPNPRPRSKPSKAPFPFLALPTELRLPIYNYLVVSTHYYYLPTNPPRSLHRGRYRLRRHGMLLASRQLHAEYAQAFYERVKFFFYIDADNGMRPATTPFWTLPPALLPNLRRCQLSVDVGMLAQVPGFSMEALAARIEALLGCMERVRRVHLQWDIRCMVEEPIWKERWEGQWEEQWWRQFGERSVQRLKGGAEMRGTTVTISASILYLQRWRPGEWSNYESVFWNFSRFGKG